MSVRDETLETLADRFRAAWALWTAMDEDEAHAPLLLSELCRLCREVVAQPVATLEEAAHKARVLASSEGLINAEAALAALCADIEHLAQRRQS